MTVNGFIIRFCGTVTATYPAPLAERAGQSQLNPERGVTPDGNLQMRKMWYERERNMR